MDAKRLQAVLDGVFETIPRHAGNPEPAAKLVRPRHLAPIAPEKRLAVIRRVDRKTAAVPASARRPEPPAEGVAALVQTDGSPHRGKAGAPRGGKNEVRAGEAARLPDQAAERLFQVPWYLVEAFVG